MLTATEIQERLALNQRFWEPLAKGEGTYLSVVAPTQGTAEVTGSTLDTRANKATDSPKAIEDNWFDVEWRVQKIITDIESTFWGGIAVPTAQVDLGPGILPALLGRPFELRWETVWFDLEPLESVEAIEALFIQHDNPFYQAYRQLTEELARQSQGRFLVALTDLGAPIDVAAALYGRERLLIDTVLEPANVVRLLKAVESWSTQLVAENRALLRPYQQHMTTWIPVPNERPWCAQLAETAVMLSAESYQELIVPSLEREATDSEQVVFNIDGYSYIRLLPEVLKLPKLHAIEFDPNPRADIPGRAIKDWTTPESIAALRRIQDAGVKLVFNGIPLEQVEPLLAQINPDGVFLHIECASATEAEVFLRA